MAEVLATYDNLVIAPDGVEYRAQAVGAPATDGTDRWEAWVEFFPSDGSEPLRSRRETTQPNREHTLYWATGLTPVFLRGALERTLSPAPAAPPVRLVSPAFDGPAPADTVPLEPDIPTVMNPFAVYRKSETHLRNQLSALSGWHLVNIIRAHGLSDLDPAALERAPQRDLVELIVAGVRLRAAG
jgi:hypothetical protein